MVPKRGIAALQTSESDSGSVSTATSDDYTSWSFTKRSKEVWRLKAADEPIPIELATFMCDGDMGWRREAAARGVVGAVAGPDGAPPSASAPSTL